MLSIASLEKVSLSPKHLRNDFLAFLNNWGHIVPPLSLQGLQLSSWYRLFHCLHALAVHRLCQGIDICIRMLAWRFLQHNKLASFGQMFFEELGLGIGTSRQFCQLAVFHFRNLTVFLIHLWNGNSWMTQNQPWVFLVTRFDSVNAFLCFLTFHWYPDFRSFSWNSIKNPKFNFW